jgi:hypothetical protein
MRYFLLALKFIPELVRLISFIVKSLKDGKLSHDEAVKASQMIVDLVYSVLTTLGVSGTTADDVAAIVKDKIL